MLRGPWLRADAGVRPYTRIGGALLMESWTRLDCSGRFGRARSITVAALILSLVAIFIFAEWRAILPSVGVAE